MKKTNRLIPFYFSREDNPVAGTAITLDTGEFPISLLRIINDTNGRLQVNFSFGTAEVATHDLIASYEVFILKAGYSEVEYYDVLPLGTIITLTPEIDDQGVVDGVVAVAAYTWMREA